MKTRRLAIAAVAVVATAGLLAGCGNKIDTSGAASASPSPSPSSTVAPKDALLASVKKLVVSSYQFNVKSGALTGTGAADGLNADERFNATGTVNGVSIKLDAIAIKTDLYVKLDFGPLNGALGIDPSKYSHIDATKLTNKSSLPIGQAGQPLDLAGLLTGLIDVKTTDGKTYTGTLDLSKATGGDGPDSDAVKKAGDAAKNVPFTATVDGSGRLTELKIDGGANPDLGFDATFSDFDKSPEVKAPDDSDVVQATSQVMNIFNS